MVSVAAATTEERDQLSVRMTALCTRFLRPPSNVVNADDLTVEFHFVPDLSEGELETFNLMVTMDPAVDFGPTEYAAVRVQMQTLRDLRQMGRATFMALTAAERDRLLYDALTAQTIIDLAILRD